MSATSRPRRSALYVPGDKLRAIEKSRTLAADVIIFDLEDAVAPQSKESARRQAVGALSAGGHGRRERVLRVNGLSTQWGRDDLIAAATSSVDAVLLPKVEGAAAVRDAESILVAAGAPAGLAIWCMIETPRGVLRAEEIAAASPRIACLVAGTTDLAKDLHATQTNDRAPLIPALAHILLAARAYQLACLDGPRLELDDAEAFAAECRQGALLGFDGKTVIHPSMIEGANRAFAPSEAEIAEARRLIAAHAEAEALGKGVTVVDGKLVEAPHVTAAQRLVRLAEQIALLVEEAGLAP
jgi:citrate lyase subunit beta/citryl-CoA lyase